MIEGGLRGMILFVSAAASAAERVLALVLDLTTILEDAAVIFPPFFSSSFSCPFILASLPFVVCVKEEGLVCVFVCSWVGLVLVSLSAYPVCVCV